MLDAALAYASRGWPVFPLNGKKPITEHGFKDATTDPATIERLWTENPRAGIGNPPPEGEIVLDIDPRAGGEESLVALAERLGPLPPTVTTKTGGDGLHLRFKVPPGVRLPKQLAPGVELKGGGTGYVILPPSPHPSGGTYRWPPFCDPEEQNVATLPPAWLEEIRRAHGNGNAQLRERVASGELIGPSQRHAALVHYGAGLRRIAMPREAAIAALRTLAETRFDLSDGRKLRENEIEEIVDWTQQKEGDQPFTPAETTPEAEKTPAWPTLDEAALYGLAGDVVRVIGPQTEADPIGVLVHFLVMFGNAVGPTPHVQVGADLHYANLFAVLVGQTSRGRKGTSEGQARRLLAAADPPWAKNQIVHGLSSGEGLIDAVRDPSKEEEENGEPTRDRRLLVIETEFAGTLRVMRRDGNALSSVVRQAWDSGNLRTMTKRSPLRATGALVSILGHATGAELLRYMGDETENGFANRILWLRVRRSKLLPDGGVVTDADLAPLYLRIAKALESARLVYEVVRSPEAAKLWWERYEGLTAEHPGLFGVVTSRAEAQVTRISLIYALLDGSKEIREEHLSAALALWDYCAASARHIFGDLIGDPIADRILRELRAIQPAGLTRTEISADLFGRNVGALLLERSLATLAASNLAFSVLEQASKRGGPRPERWFAR